MCANLDLWLLSAGNRGSMQNPQHSPWAHTHTGPHFQDRLLCGGVKKTSCFFPKHKTLIRLVWFAGFVRIAVLFVVKLHSRCLLDSFNGNGYVFEGVQLSLLSTAWRNDTIWRENPDIYRKKNIKRTSFSETKPAIRACGLLVYDTRFNNKIRKLKYPARIERDWTATHAVVKLNHDGVLILNKLNIVPRPWERGWFKLWFSLLVCRLGKFQLGIYGSAHSIPFDQADKLCSKPSMIIRILLW